MNLDVITLGVVCADVMARPVSATPQPGELAFVSNIEVHLGGLAGATAIAVSKLGAKAGVIGCVGEDGFGDYLVNTMSSNGVDVSHVRRHPNRNTSATMVLIGEDGERSFLHSIGSNAELCEDDVDLDYVSRAKVFHWGGPALNPGLDGAPIGRVMAKARSLGVKTSMDTIFDGGGGWLRHIEHVLPHLDIVMSSLEEARHYTGKDSPEDIADFYRSFGPGIVVIKLGAQGILLDTEEEKIHIPAHQVPVVDSTGAGDAACGGFLYGCVQGWDSERCARLANAVGAITVQSVGGAEASITLDWALELIAGEE